MKNRSLPNLTCRPITVRRSPERELLKGVVRTLWHYEGLSTDAFEFVLLSVHAQLLINLSENELRHWRVPGILERATGGIALQGPLTRQVLIDCAQKASICGVEFAVGGNTRFHRISAATFTNTLVDANSVWGEEASELRDALVESFDPHERLDLVEAFLAAHLLPPEPHDNLLLMRVSVALAEGCTVATIHSSTGISKYRLHRLFDERVGMRPKLFSRIARLSPVLEASVRATNWAELAAELG